MKILIIIIINRGNKVPADLRLLECIDLRIDESILTGESNPSKKFEFTLEKNDLEGVGNQKNMAFMGTLITQGKRIVFYILIIKNILGKGKGLVVATGDETGFF